MELGYRLVFSGRSIYNESDVANASDLIGVGTIAGCKARFSKEIFGQDFLLLVSETDEGWNLKCEVGVYIRHEAVPVFELDIQQGDFVSICSLASDEELFKIACFIDYESAFRQFDARIDLRGRTQITVGNTADSNIRLLDIKDHTEHFKLEIAGGYLRLSVLKSSLGIYVNGNRVVGITKIKNKDFISCGAYSFYFCDADLFFTDYKRIALNGLSCSYLHESESALVYPKFNRNTRVKETLCDEPITILDPPDIPQKPDNDLLMTLLPSILMLVLVIVLRGVLSSSGGTYIIFSVCSMALGIATSIFNYRKSKKAYATSLKEREGTYQSYIARKREEILQARNAELASLNHAYPAASETLAEVNGFSGSLFDRTVSDDDFLHIRLGVGKREAVRKISYKPRESLTLGDELQMLPENISKEFTYLEKAPIVVDLKQVGILGIVGEEASTDEIFKIIVEDLCTRQFSKEVTLFLVCTEKQSTAHDWIRFVPHFQKEAGLVRNIACDKESCELQFEYLYKTLSFRENCPKPTEFSAVVVFVLNPMGLFTNPVSHYLKNAKEFGVYFVFVAPVREELPLYCGNIIEVTGANRALLINTSNQSDTVEFEFEHLPDEQMQKMALRLAPIYCDDVSVEGDLPKNFSLFSLLGIQGADDLDLSARWSKSDITHSMAAPLGIKASGEVIYLDLHERHHGPHGLVAGTTGSGKSEILQTYVLSMATLYPPDEVGFVMIDFKGGGMANLFEDLPHLIGSITDIDGKAINRSLMSIRAEIDKRKRLFATADVNNITDYIRKYKAKDACAVQPLPHLILIIDEFAELKAEQPDFMKEVVSAARVGRSLGIHLILATQKPAGVIDDQIWSNSRFKLCLKVQSKSDSNEVLKSPLAAEIKEPGRAYLQVGNNEIFELFQSAYSGGSAKSEEMDHVNPFKLFEVDECGRKKLVYSLTRSKSQNADSDVTQLKVIVNAVKQYCDRVGIKKLAPICLPALSEKIDFVNGTSPKGSMNAFIGILDDPGRQFQGIYSLDVSQQNTLILGSAQLGKTNLLQVFIRSISEQFSPNEVNLYILDFNSLFLKNYAGLPHVGGVVCASESEKLKNFFKLINAEMAQRKDLLNAAGVSSFHAYREAGNSELPQIIIFIDNFTGLKETYFADDDPFLPICRDGLGLGISIVIANVQTAGFGYRYLSTISNRVALFCNDRDELISLFGFCRQMPEEIAGRAMIQDNKSFYDLQSYLAFSGEREIDRTMQIQEWIKKLRVRYPGVSAKKIPEVPEYLTVSGIYDMYRNLDCRECFAIAVDYDSIEPITLPFQTQFMLALIGKDVDRKQCVLDALLADIQHNIFDREIELYFVDSISKRYQQLADMPYVQKYTTNPDETLSCVERLEAELNSRAEIAEQDRLEALSEYPLELLVINSRKALDLLSASKVHMRIFDSISKNLREYGVMIIFADVANASASVSAGDIAKRIRDERKAFLFEPLKGSKLIDVSLSVARRMNVPLRKTDAFYFDGDADNPMRVKIAQD